MIDRLLILPALAGIERTPPDYVFARRRGVVVAWDVWGKDTVAFRRCNGSLQVELWRSDGHRKAVSAVPKGLSERVALVIDR